MGRGIRIQAEPQRVLAFGAFVPGVFTPIGAPLVHPSRILFIQNLTDQGVIISFDSVNDHLVLISGGSFSLDVAGNKTFEEGAYIAANTQLWATRSGAVDPAAGAVLVTTFFGVGD